MERIDDRPEERLLKALIYGNPGTGKTSIGVTAPEPLILLSERQGMTHIRHAAARLGIPTPRTLLMRTAQDYRDVLRTLRMPAAKDFVVRDRDGNEIVRFPGWWPKTCVVDSITDAMKIFAEEVQQQSPPKNGKDGLPVLPERYWGVLIDRCEKFVRLFRDLPMHTLFLALLADDRKEDDDDEESAKVGPQLATKGLRGAASAAVNVVGVTYRRVKRAKNDEIERRDGQVVYEFGVLTYGPGYMVTKPLRPLRDREVPDFGNWIGRVFEGITTAPEAPEFVPGSEGTSEPAPEAKAAPAAPEAAPPMPEPEPTHDPAVDGPAPAEPTPEPEATEEKPSTKKSRQRREEGV